MNNFFIYFGNCAFVFDEDLCKRLIDIAVELE